MPSRDDILDEARSWVGTPFHHQARKKGHGVDCAMLIVGVGEALGLMEFEFQPYGKTPNPKRMREVLERYMDPVVDGPKLGDVLYMGWRPALPMHLGFLTDLHGHGILHAYADAGEVVETAMPKHYELLIDSWWRYRGVV